MKLGNRTQKLVSFLTGFLLLGSAVIPAQAAFTDLYVFGDSISTTTNNASTGPTYYGKRFSNGRVWVEVLAERQGLLYDSNKNWSYFGHTSTALVTHVSNFIAPTNASNALFVVWVNCADLYYPAYYDGTSTNVWNNAINQSQINHYKAVTNLYFAKGARTLIMPNVVDLSTIPLFNASGHANFIHSRCLDYNIAFSNTLNQIKAACPDLTLYTPDFFALLTNILAHPTNYSVTNALYDGRSIDVVEDPALSNKTTNGPGTNHIFWDVKDPSAKVHMWMANIAQQLVSPVRISQIVLLNGSNRLDLANVPIGQNGLVLGCTNVALENFLVPWNWTTNASFSSINATQSVFVLASAGSPDPGFSADDDPWPPGPIVIPEYVWQLYRLQFPYAWTWP